MPLFAGAGISGGVMTGTWVVVVVAFCTGTMADGTTTGGVMTAGGTMIVVEVVEAVPLVWGMVLL